MSWKNAGIALGLDMDLIAKRTADVGELVLYPFCIVALLAVSRAPTLDNWGWTPGLIVVLERICWRPFGPKHAESSRESALRCVARTAKIARLCSRADR